MYHPKNISFYTNASKNRCCFMCSRQVSEFTATLDKNFLKGCLIFLYKTKGDISSLFDDMKGMSFVPDHKLKEYIGISLIFDESQTNKQFF